MNVMAKETDAKTGEAVLKIVNLESYYGPIMALRGVSLSVRQGQIVTVLGANGAGKTTLMKTISGVMDPEKGQIFYGGHDIAGSEPSDVVNGGIVHVPEGREVFPLLTVEENLEMGTFLEPKKFNERFERVGDMFPRLVERRDQRAGSLSGGERQMLAMGRALMMDPSVLLLDEPYEGLAPVIVDEIEKTLNVIKEQGITTILVEQNAVRALQLADRAVILDTGEVVFDGTAQEVLENEQLRHDYLAI